MYLVNESCFACFWPRALPHTRKNFDGGKASSGALNGGRGSRTLSTHTEKKSSQESCFPGTIYYFYFFVCSEKLNTRKAYVFRQFQKLLQVSFFLLINSFVVVLISFLSLQRPWCIGANYPVIFEVSPLQAMINVWTVDVDNSLVSQRKAFNTIGFNYDRICRTLMARQELVYSTPH